MSDSKGDCRKAQYAGYARDVLERLDRCSGAAESRRSPMTANTPGRDRLDA